jgi:hypothetical protein
MPIVQVKNENTVYVSKCKIPLILLERSKFYRFLTVLIANVDRTVNAEILKAAFIPFGDIVDVTLPPDPKSCKAVFVFILPTSYITTNMKERFL